MLATHKLEIKLKVRVPQKEGGENRAGFSVKRPVNINSVIPTERK
jgi:hypothetical protein